MSGDAERGKKLFIELCERCHSLEAIDDGKAGPHLNRLMGRKCGTCPKNFDFSDGIKAKDIIWDKTKLYLYLSDPKTYIPGSRDYMIKKVDPEQNRRDIVEFLYQASKNS